MYLLLKRNAPVDLSPDNNGKTPMDYARESRQCVDLLTRVDYNNILLALDWQNEAQKRGEIPVNSTESHSEL